MLYFDEHCLNIFTRALVKLMYVLLLNVYYTNTHFANYAVTGENGVRVYSKDTTKPINRETIN